MKEGLKQRDLFIGDWQAFEIIKVNDISIDRVMMLWDVFMTAGADTGIALPPRPFCMIMFEPVLHL